MRIVSNNVCSVVALVVLVAKRAVRRETEKGEDLFRVEILAETIQLAQTTLFAFVKKRSVIRMVRVRVSIVLNFSPEQKLLFFSAHLEHGSIFNV